MNAVVTVLHETPTRLRLRLAGARQVQQARVALDFVAGVTGLRAAPSARSITLGYDGRAATRRAILAAAAQPAAPSRPARPRRKSSALPVEAPLAVAALAPLLPPPARPVVALALVAAKVWADRRAGASATATALDALSLVTTALTGHPLTATTSVLLGSAAEWRRDALLRETDDLIGSLAPAAAGAYRALRAGHPHELAPDALLPGDELTLGAGDVVPADAIAIDGRARLVPSPVAPLTELAAGARAPAGARVQSGRVTLRIERSADESRSARLREHVRHILRTRDAPGPLTPDLERLLAVPVTAAGLVLALTGDAARTASMLQADPQLGIALAQPVAREAALYATARGGALLTGLAHLDRLAAATAIAFEDVGVLAEPVWRVERVDAHDGTVDAPQAARWLARLAGQPDDAIARAGFGDAQVAAWRVHGALLRDGDRTLHVAGAACLARTWNIALPALDRRSLVRRLGVVQDGRLVATIHLGCRLREGIAADFAQLRALGVRRIAIFTEDPAAQPAAALLSLGADAVVSRDRAAQARWLEDAVGRGERVVLVHDGLRDLLPAGGLSLCPVDAAAGADGVLLAEPLPALVNAMRVAQALRRRLRRQFGTSVALNAGLMVAAALRWLPPIATTAIKHAAVLLLLHQSTRLAAVRSRRTAPAPEPQCRVDDEPALDAARGTAR